MKNTVKFYIPQTNTKLITNRDVKMDFRDELTQVFTSAGLTVNQTKVYMALINNGKERVSQISKIANIDRSNTYQAIEQLQQKGLVQKILGSPNFFEAIPLNNAIQLVLKQKEDECRRIFAEAENLLKNLNLKETSSIKQSDVKLETSTKQKVINFINKMYPTTKESLDLLFNKKRFCEIIPEIAEKHAEVARRGVKVRMVVEKLDFRALKKPLQILVNEPNIHIKYIPFHPQADLVVFDRKFASISLLPGAGVDESPDLQSGNPGFVEIVKNHFEKIWSQAEEIECLPKQKG